VEAIERGGAMWSAPIRSTVSCMGNGRCVVTVLLRIRSGLGAVGFE
jgi:hypothetical protein